MKCVPSQVSYYQLASKLQPTVLSPVHQITRQSLPNKAVTHSTGSYQQLEEKL